MTKHAYKLLRLRKDGTLGSLFLNRRAVLTEGVWFEAEDCWKKGYKRRPGWHCLPEPIAPHLSKRGRIWCEVVIGDYAEKIRPLHQGGLWYLAKRMKIVRRLDGNT